MTRHYLLHAFSAIALLLLTACATLLEKPEPPRVSLVGLKLVSMDLFEQRYQVRLRVKNPNAVVLPVRGVDFQLDINGRAFADGVSSQSVDVPAYGEQVIALQVSSSLLQVFRQLQSLENSDAPGFAYRIDGVVSVGKSGLRLPFEYSGELASPQPAEPDARER